MKVLETLALTPTRAEPDAACPTRAWSSPAVSGLVVTHAGVDLVLLHIYFARSELSFKRSTSESSTLAT